MPFFNIINGGSHAGNKLAMQEFMVAPIGASTFAEAMRMGTEVYHHLKAVIKAKYGLDACNVGDEGGFAPSIQSNDEGLKLVTEAIEKVRGGHRVVCGEGGLRGAVYAALSPPECTRAPAALNLPPARPPPPQAGYVGKVKIAMDVAASEFFGAEDKQ